MVECINVVFGYPQYTIYCESVLRIEGMRGTDAFCILSKRNRRKIG